ncbi:DNA ligase 4-like [Oratosquilla oratoria]|uniref:DNA ligase 4-like n=1 Tax=Oratosquilla oratoria TaxID=337810 RepID=UPI003F7576A6
MSTSVASRFRWSLLCDVLEKIQAIQKDSKKKKKILFEFVKQYRDFLSEQNAKSTHSKDTFFPVIRVLLPALDRARGAYGVKEKKLAELYIRILGLKKDGNDASKLLNFRAPKTSGTSDSGDFAEVAYFVLRNRCPSEGKMTLEDVDSHLTSIAENYAMKSHGEVERVLLTMLRGMTALEQKWLIRVLLKDMKLGLGQGTIFYAWHPDAKDYYDVNNSLEKVCTTLKDPSVRLHEIEVSVFAPFRPMLAERAVLEKVEQQMDHKAFYVETKYDGERSQVHKRGNVYKYFSRNGFDFTSNFGEDPFSGLFTPHLHRLLKPSVEEVILDGEMIAWSKSRSCIVTKGEHMDVKNLKEDGDLQVCFVVFDIIYLNGTILTNLPLRERLEKIPTVVNSKEGRIMISPRVQVKTKEDVVRVLNEAIDQHEEGVVLKDPDSVYRPASRKAGWIKVKPEYVDSLVPELDLLIVGAYYGSGRKKGVLSHFLLAVAVPVDEPGAKPSQFHSICRIGSGYTVAELNNLLAKLNSNIQSHQPRGVIVSREKPDVWINPANSCIVQVRAAEIVKSELYQTGVTLRFPRVEKVRYDKPWYDALTTTQLKSLVEEASGKLATKHYIDDGEKSSPKKRAAPRVIQPTLPDHFKPADLSSVVKKDELLQKKEMCIVDGGPKWNKHQLERKVAEHGGTFTQHPGPKTFCIIADTMTIKVQNYVKSRQYNIVRPSWLIQCFEENRMVPWSPLNSVHLTEEANQAVSQLYDKYGDSFEEPVDADSLKEIFRRIKKEDLNPLTQEEMYEIDEEVCDIGSISGLFRLVTAYFYTDEVNSHPSVGNLWLRLYGARISPTLNSGVTHVILNDSNGPSASSFGRRHVVDSQWITDCVERRKLLEERHYRPGALR